MKRMALSLAGFLLLASICAAAARVEVDSNRFANVYVDGSYVGSSPMVIRDSPYGVHEVRVEDRVTGASQYFSFENRYDEDLRKSFMARFESPEVVVEKHTTVVEEPAREVVVSPRRETVVVHEDRPVYIHEDYPAVDQYLADRDRDARAKARARNVSLGVTGAGLITGSRALTGLGLGGFVVNELFH